MKIKQICVVSFSPTGGTERAARVTAGELARRLAAETRLIDFTRPENRQREYRFAPDELVLVCTPVYAGRIPNKLLPELRARILGAGQTPALAVCVFGGRSVDEALRELVLLLDGNGFHTAGAAAFVCRHAFSDRVGAGRPDDADRLQMREFARKAAEKLECGAPLSPLPIDRSEIGPYYTPLKADGTPARFLKAKPLTREDICTRCGLCVQACPIDRKSVV